MIGKPKFSMGDKVSVTMPFDNGRIVHFTGTIRIIDSYGTFEDSSDVSYDILSQDFTPDNKEVLVKHISEKYVKAL